MDTFFQMGGYAFYVWMSYGVIAALCVIEIIFTGARFNKAKVMAREQKNTHKAARLTER